MTHREYANAAIDIVIDLAAEQGLKYRRGDFRIEGVAVNNSAFLSLNTVSFVGGKKEPTGISVTLLFGHERVGKKLKACRDNFYNYKYCRVLDFGVFFGLSLAEIEIQSARETDTERSKIDDVIRKVQKILALADIDRNNSEAEAIAASLQAQKLLSKYNIDIAAVTGEEKKEDIEQVIADVGTGKKWKYTLANIIATSYCCKCFYQGTEMIVFYGYSSDVLIARRVFMYLFKVGNSLATKYVKARRDGGEWNTGGLYNSFCKGFCDGINRELQKNCTALVLVTPQAVIESFDKYSENFKKLDNSIDMNDRDAYVEGEIEGKRALNAQYIEGDKENEDCCNKAND